MAARRVEGIQVERSADEILALKAGSLEAHALNQSAAVVYDLCDGQTSKSAMAAAIQSRTGLPADEEIVDLALSELVETGLIVMDAENAASVTRRSVIRRLSLTSAVAMMLPIVESVVVPSAADAQPSAIPAPVRAPTPTPVEL